MKTNRLTYTLIVLFSILLTRCSEEGPEITSEEPIDNTPTTFNIGVSESNLSSQQIFKIGSSEFIFSKENYVANFGEDLQINLVKINDSLVGLTPTVENGNYDITIEDNGLTGTVNVAVENEVIQDIAVTFEQETRLPIQQAIENMDAIVENYTGQLSTSEQLASYSNYLKVFLQDSEQFNEKQQLELIYFFRANPEFTSVFDTENSQSIIETPFDISCFRDNFINIITANAKAAILITIATIAVIDTVGIGWPVAIVLAGSAAVGIYAAYEELIDDCLVPYEVILDEPDEPGKGKSYLKNQGTFHLKNKEAIKFQLATNYSTFSSAHSGINADVDKIISIHSEIREVWNAVAETINEYANKTVDFFNGWLSNPIEIEPIAASWIELEDEFTNVLTAVDKGSYYSLEGFPDWSGIQYEISENGALNISFDVDFDQDFPAEVSGKIIYDDGNFRFEDDITFVIENFVDLELISGNNQSGNIGYWLTNPVVLKATDFLGEPYSNIEIDLEIISGEGELSSSTILTDSDGEAQFNWKLDSDGLSTVRASIRSGDEIINQVEVSAEGKIFILNIISGNNQETHPGDHLDEPMKLIVLDANNNPKEGVSVYFSVLNGGVELSSAVSETDESGFVFNDLTVDDDFLGDIQIAAEIFDSNGNVQDSQIFDFVSLENINILNINSSYLCVNCIPYGKENHSNVQITITFEGTVPDNLSHINYHEHNSIWNGWTGRIPIQEYMIIDNNTIQYERQTYFGDSDPSVVTQMTRTFQLETISGNTSQIVTNNLPRNGAE